MGGFSSPQSGRPGPGEPNPKVAAWHRRFAKASREIAMLLAEAKQPEIAQVFCDVADRHEKRVNEQDPEFEQS